MGLLPIALLGTIVGACSQGSASTQSPVVLGLTSTAAPYYSDDELTLYEAQKPVALPIIKPTAAQEAALGAQSPYPHAPYLLASDITVEIHFTLSNLDPEDHTVELLIDPWNEFVRWDPGVTIVDDDDTEPNLSGYDNYFVVPAMSRIEGDLTTDDTYNLEANLATVENVLGMNPPPNLSVGLTEMCNHIFDIQHRSNDGDPLVTPFIPSVIAGLTGFHLGIRTPEPANVAVEIVVDLVDQNGNRVITPGSNDQTINPPAKVLSPPGALATDTAPAD
ncbi:MAG: hypothetical protein ACLQVI_38435 [Polyangiaceae bacterium]